MAHKMLKSATLMLRQTHTYRWHHLWNPTRTNRKGISLPSTVITFTSNYKDTAGGWEHGSSGREAEFKPSTAINKDTAVGSQLYKSPGPTQTSGSNIIKVGTREYESLESSSYLMHNQIEISTYYTRLLLRAICTYKYWYAVW
jgi:hypothetical protein